MNNFQLEHMRLLTLPIYVYSLRIFTSAVLRFLRKNIITCFSEAITSNLQSNLRNKNIFDIFLTVLYCRWPLSRLFPSPLNSSTCLERTENCSVKTEAHRKCWYKMKRDNLQKKSSTTELQKVLNIAVFLFQIQTFGHWDIFMVVCIHALACLYVFFENFVEHVLSMFTTSSPKIYFPYPPYLNLCIPLFQEHIKSHFFLQKFII